MKKSVILLSMVALLASCMQDDLGQQGEEYASKVTLTSEPYTFEDGTRTTLTNSGAAISFAWDEDETIGIFPVAPTTNNQAKQKLNGGTGDGTTSTFDGAGWALKKGNTYAAYYPYVKNLDEDKGYTAVPVDMTGQTQDGNNSLAHIGAGYDYMYAESTVPSSGTMQFDFKHVASIVMLELTMPEAATWSSISLSGTGSVFTTKGTMNVSTGAVTGTTKSNIISLDLENVTTTSANENVTLYMAVLPCTTGALTLTAKTSEGKSYTAILATKTLQAGHAYKWTATLEAYTPPVYIGYVDMSDMFYFYFEKTLKDYLTKEIVTSDSHEDTNLSYIYENETYNCKVMTHFISVSGNNINDESVKSGTIYGINCIDNSNYKESLDAIRYYTLLVPSEITYTPNTEYNLGYYPFSGISGGYDNNDGKVSYTEKDDSSNSLNINGITYYIYTMSTSLNDTSKFNVKFT